jgi:glycosyltransferase involved in cell wall biosynthesis
MGIMRILAINRSDSEGGAAKAAFRLVEGVRQLGEDARLFVQNHSMSDPFILSNPAVPGKASALARRVFESFLVMLSSGRTQGLFSPAWIPDRLSSTVSTFAPDIIHLHWVARMMRLETLGRLNVPIVWTLHDSWPFTGGCFLPSECDRYQENCGKCPILDSSRENDLSRWIWQRKNKAWQSLNLTLVAPSRWMRDCAKASSLFRGKRIEVIPNGLNIKRFLPTDKQTARERLSLPQNKHLILFGAKSATQDRNKGFHLLTQALSELATNKRSKEIELVVFGSPQPEKPSDLGLKTHFMGWQNDETTLALIYAAADVFAFPSIQESLGYTAMEAMACGTPCVAFHQGGVPDLIDHLHNGYLATTLDPADLARGIIWVLEDSQRHKELAVRSRQKVVREFAIEKVAEKHLALYRDLLQKQ